MRTRRRIARGAPGGRSRSKARRHPIPGGRSSMSVRCFVDASVLLHARDPRDPLKQARAAEWLARLWQQRPGRTSIPALSEVYITATRQLTPRLPEDLAWEELVRHLARAPP